MKEIKFRGKSIDTGEWLYGDILIHGGIAQIWVNTDDGKWNYIVDPETVGQFTGLYDKNGQPIYEGDKVWCRSGEHRSGVWEYEKQFVVEYGWSQSMWEMSMCDEIEVIGNIHDQED